MRALGAIVLAVVVLSMAACGDDGNGGSGSPRPADTAEEEAGRSEPTVAEKLATIQTGQPVSATDPLVRRFNQVLDALEQKCKDRRIMLSDLTVRAQQLLRKAGIDKSLESIITHVNGSIPKGIPRQRCTSVFAAYVTLRKG